MSLLSLVSKQHQPPFRNLTMKAYVYNKTVFGFEATRLIELQVSGFTTHIVTNADIIICLDYDEYVEASKMFFGDFHYVIYSLDATGVIPDSLPMNCEWIGVQNADETVDRLLELNKLTLKQLRRPQVSTVSVLKQAA